MPNHWTLFRLADSGKRRRLGGNENGTCFASAKFGSTGCTPVTTAFDMSSQSAQITVALAMEDDPSPGPWIRMRELFNNNNMAEIVRTTNVKVERCGVVRGRLFTGGPSRIVLFVRRWSFFSAESSISREFVSYQRVIVIRVTCSCCHITERVMAQLLRSNHTYVDVFIDFSSSLLILRFTWIAQFHPHRRIITVRTYPADW